MDDFAPRRREPDDGGILHAAAREERRLDILGVDVRAVRGNDEVFLPPFQEHPARAERAQVTGAEPSVRGEGRFRLLGILIVPARDVGAMREDFAVVRDAELLSGKRLPHGTDALVIREIAGEDRRGFREPVALDQGYAEHAPKLLEVRRDRRVSGCGGR